VRCGYKALRSGILVLTAAFALLASPAHAERRVALVVGNGAYVHASRLNNPANDAVDITAALKRLDFEVIQGSDLGSETFDAAVQTFATKLIGAGLAVFYYSGHGLQFDGSNYLIPVDTKVDGTYGLKKKAVIAQDVVDLMKRGAKASLVFLDACRSSALTRDLAQSLPEQMRSAGVTRGLARMTANGNSLIAFAAAPNDVAADGTGQRRSAQAHRDARHRRSANVD
jgi:uncharacterized caspase-like protein